MHIITCMLDVNRLVVLTFVFSRPGTKDSLLNNYVLLIFSSNHLSSVLCIDCFLEVNRSRPPAMQNKPSYGCQVMVQVKFRFFMVI